jgi:hypothetical protein
MVQMAKGKRVKRVEDDYSARWCVKSEECRTGLYKKKIG